MYMTSSKTLAPFAAALSLSGEKLSTSPIGRFVIFSAVNILTAQFMGFTSQYIATE